MNIFKVTKDNWEEGISLAKEILLKGGMVVYPTETCYGIAVDGTNDIALSKLLSYKTFRGSKPISVAVCDIDMARRYVILNDMALNIYTNYLPGPITVVSQSTGVLKPPVVSKQNTLGIRIPDYEFTLQLIKELDRPITSTSANVSYKPHPYSIEQLIKDLPKKSLDMIDLFLDAGTLPKNVPSTVLDTTLNELTILREGKIQFEDALVKSKLIKNVQTNTPEKTISLGKEFSDTYLKGKESIVVALSGELGAGKTQFTKGIGESLGVKDIVNSPTYTIINEYPYDNRVLAHMDTWRLNDENELYNCGLIEHLDKGNIVVIEWADKFYQELQLLCDQRSIPMYKVNFKYISLEERDISIYED